jgi:activator of 2-hydroxyglutaryl-CoA dehydratase
MDQNDVVLFNDYQRTKSKPFETIRDQLNIIFEHFKSTDIILAAATGTSGRFFAKLLDIPFVNEVPAQAAAVCKLYPDFHNTTIIEMGGQDSKLITIALSRGKTIIHDFALNTGCAAGTGSFLDQQADRLGISIEDEFGNLALQSKNVPRMAGRCSVFAKSDMIHLQQQATPNCDIIAGLCQALASNLKSNLGRGRVFVKPVIFTGGVAANIGVVRAIQRVFELKEDEFYPLHVWNPSKNKPCLLQPVQSTPAYLKRLDHRLMPILVSMSVQSARTSLSWTTKDEYFQRLT